MVVERVVVNSVPTAVEIMWEMEEGETAIEERWQVFELLHHDACGRGEDSYPPAMTTPRVNDQASESTSVPISSRNSSPSVSKRLFLPLLGPSSGQ